MLDANLCLDINYFTFDFNQLGRTMTWGDGWSASKDRSDACFIRCVDYRRKE